MLLQYLSDNKQLSLREKDGTDGQSERSQVLEQSSDYFTLLELRTKNPAPNSPFACRHLIFQFRKETEDHIAFHYHELQSQMESLEDMNFELASDVYTIKADAVKLCFTMYDGKTVLAITKDLKQKAISSQSCHVCLCKP